MKTPYCLFLLLALLSFGSCNKPKHTAEALCRAEALMYTSPDSALQMLEAIPDPELLTGETQADYALLLSLARYRCYVPATSDSLINIAVQYYKDNGTADKKGMTWYTYGSILEECKADSKTIIHAYKNADQQTPFMQDDKTAAFIFSRLGFLNQSAGDYELAKRYYNKAVHINSKNENQHSLARNYLNLFRIHYLSGEEDSLDWYVDKLLELENTLADSLLKSKIHQNIGVRYMYQNDYEEAERHLTTALKLNAENVSIGLSLAKIYQNNNLNEKVDSLYLSLSSCADVTIRTNALKNVLGGLLQKNNLSTYTLFKKYTLTADSAYSQLYNLKLSKLQNEFDKVSLMNENIRLYNYWLVSIGIFISIFVLGSIFLYRFYLGKKKKLLELQTSLICLKNEKLQLLSEKEQDNAFLCTRQEKENRLAALDEEIASLQKKERRLKEGIKRLDSVKQRFHSSNADDIEKAYLVHRSLIQQSIYHPATDRLYLKIFLNHSLHGFSDRLSDLYPSLKDRDLDICYLLALQLTVDEIAKILNISTDSIKRYMRKITKEMQVVSNDSVSLHDRISFLRIRSS